MMFGVKKIVCHLIYFFIFILSSPFSSSTINCQPNDTSSTSSQSTTATISWCANSPQINSNSFFTFDAPQRQDIIENKNGILFKFIIKVIHSSTCKPLPNLIVHVWHADAHGFYSGFSLSQLKDCSGDAFCKPNNNLRFLRGYQVTNKNGSVKFISIAPGWLEKRTIHVNVLIMKNNNQIIYTGELYFTRKVAQLIASNKPYSTCKNIRLNNDKDVNYQQFNGSQNVFQLEGGLRELRGGIVLTMDYDDDNLIG